MLSTIFSSIKTYIYVAVFAAIIAAWAFDRHNQYEKGQQDCQTAALNAQIKSANEAVKSTDIIRKQIDNIQSTKQQDLVTIHEASTKANHSNDCTLSSDELFILNTKINSINGIPSSSSSNGKMSKPRTNSNRTIKHPNFTNVVGK